MKEHLNERDLVALAAGTATVADEARAEAHMAECTTCREAMEAYRAIGEALADDAAPAPPPEAWAKMARRAASQERNPGVPRSARGITGLVSAPAWRWAMLAIVFLCGYWLRGFQQGAARPTMIPIPSEQLATMPPAHDDDTAPSAGSVYDSVIPTSTPLVSKMVLTVMVDDRRM